MTVKCEFSLLIEVKILFLPPDLPPVKKNFYIESEKTSSMSQEQVDNWRWDSFNTF